MAYDYNRAKQVWDSMNDQQKKQYTEQNKNDANFQQFAQQYHNETQGSSVWGVNQNNNNNYWWWTNTPPVQNNNQNQNNDNGVNYDFSNYHSSLSDWKNWDWKFYGNTQFDKEEQFDSSMIGNTQWIKIQEWTGKDTGRPDYQIDTDARLNEMRNNLNQYFQTNPEWFQDRETFNKQFEYNQRESEAQRALLDSYWKKAQDMRTVNNYTNWDSVMAGFNNYDITPDQMSLLRQYNPEAYAQWQKQMQDELNARITNLAAPRDVWDTVDLWWEIVKKLWIEAGDPYDIYGTWYNMAEQLWVFRDSQQLASMSNNIASIYATMNSNVQNISSQLEGRYSAGYIEARINKANSRLNSQASSMQYSYNLLLQNRNQNMAIAQQAWYMKQAQGQEDTRAFNDKLNSLKFAMTTDSYRTPEQQQQLLLQTEQIRNDMSLLNQSKLNDLSLYNQYATAKLKNQLEYELQDLNVKDPAQLKANLSRVLDEYYKEYWDIIQRPKQQVIDDVLKLAKESWISVAEALKSNFITPLQNKKEYIQAVADKYWMNPTQSIQNVWDKVALVTKYPNGKVSYQILDDVYNPKYDIKKVNWRDYLVVDDWNRVPQLKYIGSDWTVLNYSSLAQWLQSFMSKYDDWEFYKDKWCWYFVNEYLTDIWDAGHVWSTWESKKALCNNKDWANMAIWSIVAIDSKATYTNDKWEKVNAWHVSIVAWYDPATWKVLLYDANKNWDWKVWYWETTVDKLYWYYTPEVYKTVWTELPEYLDKVNEYWFIDAMVWTYWKYLAWDITVQKRIDNLWWDAAIIEQINNWLNYLNTKWKNKDGYIEWAEELYENYLESGKAPSSSYLRPLGWFNEFRDQAKAYWETVWYWRYAKVNDKWYYDDLTNLYDEYIKTNKVPTEAQVEAYGWLDDFYKTAKAYAQNVGYRFTPEEQTKEISEMRDKWLTSQEYKDMMWRVDAFDSINAMLTTGKWAYGDYTAIYLLNKLRDPDSVVREWEFANTQNVWGIDDRIFNYFKKLQNWERLNDNQRVEIQNTLNALMKSKTNTYNNSLSQYRSSALKWWDTSKIWALISISNLWKISFGNLTWDIIEPPHPDELN